MMSMIAWIVLGLVAGFLASKFVSRGGDRVVLYLVLGVVGAASGGYLFDMLGARPVTGFIDIWSLFVALLGAVVLLVAFHTVRGRLFRT